MEALGRLKIHLDSLYNRLNRRCYIPPDPLQFLHQYRNPQDREIAGIIAASLAFGNVRQILRSVASVLGCMRRPSAYLRHTTRAQLVRAFQGFQHRYVTGAELSEMLCGVKRVREAYGSLGACFIAGLTPNDETILPALDAFVSQLRAPGSPSCNYLVPQPSRGSACKRWNLYLRWMVRSDDVDPGGWTDVSPALLVVPLDTHMHRISRALGLTSRKAGDIRTALEITAAFRRLVPGDPVRYDFALTRLGIRDDTNMADFLRDCGQAVR